MNKLFLVIIIVVSSFIFFSCSEESNLTETETSNSTLLKSFGPSVNGQATIIWNTEPQIYSFHASEKDGIVTGSVQVYAKASNAKGHGTITCMAIDGNEVTLSGEYTMARLDGEKVPITLYFWLHAIDNGEGSGSTDQFVDWIDYDTPFDCNEDPSGGSIADVVAGNVQIKP